MIRIFNHYVPGRSLTLLAGEIAMVFLSFGVSILLGYGRNAGHLLSDPTVVYRVLLIALAAFLCSHYFEQYDLGKLASSRDTYRRVVSIVGVLALLSSILTFI